MNFAELLWETVQDLRRLMRGFTFKGKSSFAHDEVLWQNSVSFYRCKMQ